MRLYSVPLSENKTLACRGPTRSSHGTPVVDSLALQERICDCEVNSLLRRTDKPEPFIHLTCENTYEAENPRRVGSLERGQPLSTGSRP